MAHLAHQMLRPRNITAVERDPVVVEIARTYMGVDSTPDLDIRVADVHHALAELRTGEKFDLVVEDVFYLGFPTRADDFVRAYIASLADVVSATGTVAFNRWFRRWSGEKIDTGQALLARLLSERFEGVANRKVIQRWQNELIFASGLKGC